MKVGFCHFVADYSRVDDGKWLLHVEVQQPSSLNELLTGYELMVTLMVSTLLPLRPWMM